MKELVEKVEAFKCSICGEIHETEVLASQCVFEHAQLQLVNSLLNAGYYLGVIEHTNWDIANRKVITNPTVMILGKDFKK